jgi:hypothetical protein
LGASLFIGGLTLDYIAEVLLSPVANPTIFDYVGCMGFIRSLKAVLFCD